METKAALTDDQDLVLSMLRSGSCSVEEIARAIRKHERTAYRILKSIQEEHGMKIVRYAEKGVNRFSLHEK